MTMNNQGRPTAPGTQTAQKQHTGPPDRTRSQHPC